MRFQFPGAIAPFLFAGLAALGLPSAPGQTAAPGFQLSPAPTFAGSLHELSSGEFLRFNGSTLARLASDGSVLAVFATFSPAVFGGAFAVAPDESFAIFGESSNGGLYRLDLPDGPLTPLGTLDFNFDAAISAAGDVVVSAAATSFAFNDLVRVDPFTGLFTYLGNVPGPSGPVAFDSAGNLWYGTQSSAFPAPLGSSSILRWFPFQLVANGLSASNALVWQTGLDGAGGLAVDPITQAVYVAESNFSPGYVSTLRRVSQLGQPNPVLFSGPPGAFVSLQQFQLTGGVGQFAPYQPADVGRIRVSWNDFAGNSGVRSLAPARPDAAFTGPGAQGFGPCQLEVSGAVPMGFGVVLIGPTSLLQPAEVVVAAPSGLPLVSDLDPFSAVLVPGVLQADGAGNFQLPFFHGGEFTGLVSAQAVVLDGSLRALGTSNTAAL